MSKEYKLVFDKLQIRSPMDASKPRYMVKGTALIANKKDTAEFKRRPNGSYEVSHSIFTPKCIESIKEQAKHKRIFVDTQHELVRNAGIKQMVKGKITPEQQKELDSMLKGTNFPLAKVTGIEIEGDHLNIETELNPMFRELDEDHQRFFDAVWYSLENDYLNGISVNFGEFEMKEDEQGNTIIDNIDILGFSYVDQPASHANSIYEVAIRSSQDKSGEDKTMENDKAQLENDRKAFEAEKQAFEAQKVADATAKAEASKQSEIQKLKDEHAETKRLLDEKTAEAKTASEERDSAKGQVSYKTPPASPQGKPGLMTPDVMQSKIKEITAEHDKTIATIRSGKTPMIDQTFHGFAEMVNLQAQAKNPTAGMDSRNADFIAESRLLDRAPSDLTTPKYNEA